MEVLGLAEAHVERGDTVVQRQPSLHGAVLGELM
jgi:hypothetical protein